MKMWKILFKWVNICSDSRAMKGSRQLDNKQSGNDQAGAAI